ncbi:MAG TPA: formate dehydrogenase accessory sulfurtransferase FdhD [Anaerolineae bacterium]|nr:formate dehydrogenase accessory sulfurtransferase FdhD [Anaerolineae bacterium]
MLTLHVNGQPLVSLMCTPVQQEELALGFLFNEHLVESLADVKVLELCGGGQCVDVWLTHDIEPPRLRTITSGCTGGTTFADVAQTQHRVHSTLRLAPALVTRLMEELARSAKIYHRSGGIHTAALTAGERLLHVVEDVGRHNALDKLAGLCLRAGDDMRDRVLLTTGRISSEMVSKIARMEVPIAISRTSPTSLAVRLAQEWHITLIGYTRRRSFRVYTHPERIVAGES